MRECGLKFSVICAKSDASLSLPVRECGLKLSAQTFYCKTLSRHSLCGSVDWNLSVISWGSTQVGHSLCGSVDWNAIFVKADDAVVCHSLCGSVDWNFLGCVVQIIHTLVTPCAGVWIEISVLPFVFCVLPSLPVRECGLKSYIDTFRVVCFKSLPVRECGLK